MNVEEIMTRDVKSCRVDTDLAAAAEILWRNNCGALPVLDSAGKLIGILTDRDICIALGTRDSRASDLRARDVATNRVFTCRVHDDVHAALRTMQEHKIRRVPVVQDGRLAGILSLDDVVLRAEKTEGKKIASISYEDTVNTMKAICEHRVATAA